MILIRTLYWFGTQADTGLRVLLIAKSSALYINLCENMLQNSWSLWNSGLNTLGSITFQIQWKMFRIEPISWCLKIARLLPITKVSNWNVNLLIKLRATGQPKLQWKIWSHNEYISLWSKYHWPLRTSCYIGLLLRWNIRQTVFVQHVLKGTFL